MDMIWLLILVLSWIMGGTMNYKIISFLYMQLYIWLIFLAYKFVLADLLGDMDYWAWMAAVSPRFWMQ